MKIVLATRNPGKVHEIASRLADTDIQVMSASDFDDVPDVHEDADTLEGNAIKKARALFEATGVSALADDTGLEVRALDGRPGVRSARFAGEGASDAANRSRLLEQLVDKTDRSARFRTVLAFIDASGEHLFEGICNGRISEVQRGNSGFGYDPVFLPEAEMRTFAEMSTEEKNAISHRGRAVDAFVEYIRSRST
jgi:XTP/dITP diphosphohydrolase